MLCHAAKASAGVRTLDLALAVVAEARALDDARQEPEVDAARVVRGAQDGKRRDGEAVAREEHLFADPVLRDGDTGGGRRHARGSSQEFQRGGRHVLEFGRRRARDGG